MAQEEQHHNSEQAGFRQRRSLYYQLPSIAKKDRREVSREETHPYCMDRLGDGLRQCMEGGVKAKTPKMQCILLYVPVDLPVPERQESRSSLYEEYS